MLGRLSYENIASRGGAELVDFNENTVSHISYQLQTRGCVQTANGKPQRNAMNQVVPEITAYHPSAAPTSHTPTSPNYDLLAAVEIQTRANETTKNNVRIHAQTNLSLISANTSPSGSAPLSSLRLSNESSSVRLQRDRRVSTRRSYSMQG